MANIAKLSVMLTANAKRFNTGLMGASRSLQSFAHRNRAVARQISTGLTRALRTSAIAAIGAGGALAYMTAQTAGEVDSQVKLARRLGISHKQLEAYGLAARRNGIDNAKLSASFEKLHDVLGSARMGESSGIKALENVGLTVEQIDRLRPEERFQAIANAVARIPDISDRTAAARDLFGRGGGALLNLFASGSEAIQQATRDVETFGTSLTDIQGKVLEMANDSFADLKELGKGALTQLAKESAPIIKKVSDDIVAEFEKRGGVADSIAGLFDRIVGKLNQFLIFSYDIAAAWHSTRLAVLSVASISGMFSDSLRIGFEEEIGAAMNDLRDLAKKRKAAMEENPFQRYLEDSRREAIDAANAPGPMGPGDPNADHVNRAREFGNRQRYESFRRRFPDAPVPEIPGVRRTSMKGGETPVRLSDQDRAVLNEIRHNTGKANLAYLG